WSSSKGTTPPPPVLKSLPLYYFGRSNRTTAAIRLGPHPGKAQRAILPIVPLRTDRRIVVGPRQTVRPETAPLTGACLGGSWGRRFPWRLPITAQKRDAAQPAGTSTWHCRSRTR